MMTTVGLIYVSGVSISLILMLLIYSYYNNHKEYGELDEIEGAFGLILFSWITVVFLVLGYKKQIKEMLSFKRNDDTAI